MAAPKGNQFWKKRTKHGRDKLFSDPEILWKECEGYFEWVEANPLYEAKAFAFQGMVTVEKVPKMRAMTLAGMCLHLGIDETTWREYRKLKDFSTVCTRVEATLDSQKLEGAAADLLNANIIARVLGLTDKKDLNHDVGDGLGKLLDAVANNGSKLGDD